MFRTALQLLIVAATGLVLACGSNANPTAPNVSDLELGESSGNARGGRAAFPTFTVEVFLGADSASPKTIAMSNRKETGFNTADMELNLTLLDGLLPGGSSGCADFADNAGTVMGSFGTGGLKRPWAAFFDFEVGNVVHFIDFSPATIDSTDWLPASKDGSNIMRGTVINVQVNKGRDKKGGCNGTFDQAWEFRVTRN